MDQPLATIVITTRNRKEDLRNAIRSALMQDVPIEVLVIDDASSDGTSEMVKSEFPQVRLDRTEENLGLIAQRTRAAGLAAAPIIVTIDDDALFITPATVRQTLGDFCDERIGVVAIPYIDVNTSPAVRQKSPDQRVWISSDYRGTAHALRRDLFLQLGGYRAILYRQGEESDYAIRVLASGHYVRLGTADPIHHLESPRRSKPLIAYYHGRNDALFAWQNAPLPYLLFFLPQTSAAAWRASMRAGNGWACLRGIAAALLMGLRGKVMRRPVERRSYLAYRRLCRNGPTPQECLG